MNILGGKMKNISDFSITIKEHTSKVTGFSQQPEPLKSIVISITGDQTTIMKVRREVNNILFKSGDECDAQS
jgi:hypothetical protein